MTVLVETPEASSAASAGVASYPVGFRSEATSEIVVELLIGGVVTPQVEGVDYDISGWSALTTPGDVVFRAGRLPHDNQGATSVIRRRVTPAAQAEAFGDSAKFQPLRNEQAFDRLTRMLQESRARLDRAALAPVGDPGVRFPALADRSEGLFLRFGADGNVEAVELASDLADQIVPILYSGIVSDAIVNGSSLAPTQNAVFDALALKAPLASPSLTTPTLASPIFTGTATLPSGQYRAWTGSNADIDGLLAGSTQGGILDSALGFHSLVGIRANDRQDAFAVLYTGKVLVNPLATTSGSSTVRVTDANHPYQVGDSIALNVASAVGGITTGNLGGTRAVTAIDPTVPPAWWEYAAGAAASSTSTGGGNVTLVNNTRGYRSNLLNLDIDTGLTLAHDLIVAGGARSPSAVISSDAGVAAGLAFRDGLLNRYVLGKTGGAAFSIFRYDASGVLQDTPFSIAAGVGGAVSILNAALTGTPTAPTAPDLTNTTQVATTAHVYSAVDGLAGQDGARLGIKPSNPNNLGALVIALGLGGGDEIVLGQGVHNVNVTAGALVTLLAPAAGTRIRGQGRGKTKLRFTITDTGFKNLLNLTASFTLIDLDVEIVSMAGAQATLISHGGGDLLCWNVGFYGDMADVAGVTDRNLWFYSLAGATTSARFLGCYADKLTYACLKRNLATFANNNILFEDWEYGTLYGGGPNFNSPGATSTGFTLRRAVLGANPITVGHDVMSAAWANVHGIDLDDVRIADPNTSAALHFEENCQGVTLRKIYGKRNQTDGIRVLDNNIGSQLALAVNPLQTTNLSTTVRVNTPTPHGYAVGESISLAWTGTAPGSVNGIAYANLTGARVVTNVDAVNGLWLEFTAGAGDAASSTASGGGGTVDSPMVLYGENARNYRGCSGFNLLSIDLEQTNANRGSSIGLNIGYDSRGVRSLADLRGSVGRYVNFDIGALLPFDVDAPLELGQQTFERCRIGAQFPVNRAQDLGGWTFKGNDIAIYANAGGLFTGGHMIDNAREFLIDGTGNEPLAWLDGKVTRTNRTFTGGSVWSYHPLVRDVKRVRLDLTSHAKILSTARTEMNGSLVNAAVQRLGNNPLAVTNGSGVVTVTETSHGRATGDTVVIEGATDTGGIAAANLNGSRSITVVTANTYTFTAGGGATASSTATGGGASVDASHSVVTPLGRWAPGSLQITPWFGHQAVTAGIAAGGTDNAIGDILTVVGGTLPTNGQAAQFRVLTLAGTAALTVELVRGGQYVLGGRPTGPVSVTSSGIGTGVTLNLTWENLLALAVFSSAGSDGVGQITAQLGGRIVFVD